MYRELNMSYRSFIEMTEAYFAKLNKENRALFMTLPWICTEVGVWVWPGRWGIWTGEGEWG